MLTHDESGAQLPVASASLPAVASVSYGDGEAFFGVAVTGGRMHRRAADFTSQARERHGLDLSVEEFPEGTKTAADAAEAVGCDVGQIASSLVFEADGDLVVVVTSGSNRVDESRLAEHIGVEAVEMADPETISEVIGWSIGGVPPLCHEADVPVFLDETLLGYERVWAAAGTPTAVFPIGPEKLRRIAGATPIEV